jgi:hypothetical protein
LLVVLALIYGPVVPYGVTKEQEVKCAGGELCGLQESELTVWDG